ncbi:hypothetical protein Phi39:1_gp36 [Cellulophaga phage phi39:1]|uniref:hypothetical protein n=1 Tax=Cellulophaga phage phi39:1 TaxID=1327993 RepID=UPI000351B1C7|nr:hypothetical protein Phi39:1_gp36 [Cellulophaga phage phi39:1]AGO49151.1 hypothetical protein Phi39:1_gp36 [Cellulophaga phage phi39:1]
MINKQNCKVGKITAVLDTKIIVIKPAKLICSKICFPIPILGYPGEYCEKCYKSN